MPYIKKILVIGNNKKVNKMNISEKRLKELERTEAKMNALEAGGVDSWEWYGESLKEYRAENELEEKREELLDELEVIFGQCAYEPSERGAGVAFTDDCRIEAMETIAKFNVIFKDDE